MTKSRTISQIWSFGNKSACFKPQTRRRAWINRDDSQLARHSTARVIAAIAAHEIPLQQWPKLLPFLHSQMTSAVATQREIGIFILYTVLEEVMDTLESHITEFFQLFDRLLRDPESLEVRITTCK